MSCHGCPDNLRFEAWSFVPDMFHIDLRSLTNGNSIAKPLWVTQEKCEYDKQTRSAELHQKHDNLTMNLRET